MVVIQWEYSRIMIKEYTDLGPPIHIIVLLSSCCSLLWGPHFGPFMPGMNSMADSMFELFQDGLLGFPRVLGSQGGFVFPHLYPRLHLFPSPQGSHGKSDCKVEGGRFGFGSRASLCGRTGTREGVFTQQELLHRSLRPRETF